MEPSRPYRLLHRHLKASPAISNTLRHPGLPTWSRNRVGQLGHVHAMGQPGHLDVLGDNWSVLLALPAVERYQCYKHGWNLQSPEQRVVRRDDQSQPVTSPTASVVPTQISSTCICPTNLDQVRIWTRR